MKKFILTQKKDNVVTAITTLKCLTTLAVKENQKILVLDNIPFGHKCAIREIQRGGRVIKYGEVIGLATRKIQPGEHVHVHNIRSIRGTKGRTVR